MSKRYYRPLVDPTGHMSSSQFVLAGGWARFSQVEVLDRAESRVIDAADLPDTVLSRLTAPRAALTGLDMGSPKIMGILNVTPDSFSDGGKFHDADLAIAQAKNMAAAGADILDIGGESTRPGADFVPVEDEIARTQPVIGALSQALDTPLSIDTRKSVVADAAVNAGAAIINDVSGLCFDADMTGLVTKRDLPVCIMHAQGDPKTMQKDPSYDNVLLDVYDWLEQQIDCAVENGIQRDAIVVDPGIGFGKTLKHNLELMRGLSIFHGLGCPVLLGASRKRFIGTLSGEDAAEKRVSGSVSVALSGLAQGMQITRVHDVAETKQAYDLWMAMNG